MSKGQVWGSKTRTHLAFLHSTAMLDYSRLEKGFHFSMYSIRQEGSYATSKSLFYFMGWGGQLWTLCTLNPARRSRTRGSKGILKYDPLGFTRHGCQNEFPENWGCSLTFFGCFWREKATRCFYISMQMLLHTVYKFPAKKDLSIRRRIVV